MDNALDEFVRRYFPRTHRYILTRGVRVKVAVACRRVATECDLHPDKKMPDSALTVLAGEVLAATNATATLFPAPLANFARDNSPPAPVKELAILSPLPRRILQIRQMLSSHFNPCVGTRRFPGQTPARVAHPEPPTEHLFPLPGQSEPTLRLPEPTRRIQGYPRYPRVRKIVPTNW